MVGRGRGPDLGRGALRRGKALAAGRAEQGGRHHRQGLPESHAHRRIGGGVGGAALQRHRPAAGGGPVGRDVDERRLVAADEPRIVDHGQYRDAGAAVGGGGWLLRRAPGRAAGRRAARRARPRGRRRHDARRAAAGRMSGAAGRSVCRRNRGARARTGFVSTSSVAAMAA
ncbi:hypothetical protein EFP18_06845 [Burkholderia glumae]|nr:hypothetical protein CEQ24_001630 [Burkholderia glumae]RQZ69291.1 hypothetical protein DF052_22050 [Burkholderia glumae]UVS83912.1 hypothetical protein EFP18_06845 [Burkholderia glumae]UVS92540.1 hypothetical protein EFP17_22710 [Burkholderia glumae]UVT03089.1 hypothetical protein EFP20_16620 [Burkholderia glumae]